LGSQSTSTGRLESVSERKGSLVQINPIMMDSIIEVPPRPQRDSTELDLEAMGVRVDRSYSVHSGK
jgi:pheromone alpha factor receptor